MIATQVYVVNNMTNGVSLSHANNSGLNNNLSQCEALS